MPKTEHSPVSPNGATVDPSFDALRKILLAPEQEALAELRQKVDATEISSDELSRVLPESIEKSRRLGTGLSQSLGPVIDEAIKESIKSDPEALADAISPIMMPAIRRSVLQMISGMAQSFNRSLEQSLSIQGIQWRIEAIRTGRTFSEVAMLHSLVYRVEQVFLIHRHTGLMLANLTNAETTVIDADMVSGMLTAIQDFVRDSFSDGKRELLNTMDCDEHDVLIEYGPKAILAVVVSGIAPPELRETVAETLDHIHAEHASSLERFDGDAEPFQATQPLLQRCLASQMRQEKPASQRSAAEESAAEKSPEKANPGAIDRMAWILPLALLFALLTWGVFRYRAAKRIEEFITATAMPTTVTASYASSTVYLSGASHNEWLQRFPERTSRLKWLKSVDRSQVTDLDEPWLNFLDQLDLQPGIVVTNSSRSGNMYILKGLRDPLAADPAQLLKKSGIKPTSVKMSWSPYQSLDARIVEQRVADLLMPPPTVRVKYHNEKLWFVGTSPGSWWRTAHPRAAAMLGDRQLDYSELQISDPRLDRYIDRLHDEPGIVVTAIDWHDGRIRVRGRRDEYAVDPTALLDECGIGRDEMIHGWEFEVSADPVIIKRRFLDKLDVPDTVDLRVQEDRVYLSGSANVDWLASLPKRIREMEGVGSIDYARVAPTGMAHLDGQSSNCPPTGHPTEPSGFGPPAQLADDEYAAARGHGRETSFDCHNSQVGFAERLRLGRSLSPPQIDRSFRTEGASE